MKRVKPSNGGQRRAKKLSKLKPRLALTWQLAHELKMRSTVLDARAGSTSKRVGCAAP